MRYVVSTIQLTNHGNPLSYFDTVMKTLSFLCLCLAVGTLAFTSCSSRERSTSGIANEQGMITGNKTKVERKKITMEDVRRNTIGTIPDW